MTKFRKKTEMIEAVKWDGRLETIETNIWLEDSIKEDRVILGMNDLHDKEPILILLYGGKETGDIVEVGEYIIKKSIKEGYRIKALPSEYFEKEYEEIKSIMEVGIDTTEFNVELDKVEHRLNNIKKLSEEVIECKSVPYMVEEGVATLESQPITHNININISTKDLYYDAEDITKKLVERLQSNAK